MNKYMTYIKKNKKLYKVTETEIDLGKLENEKKDIEELLKEPKPSDKELLELGREKYDLEHTFFYEARIREIDEQLEKLNKVK